MLSSPLTEWDSLAVLVCDCKIVVDRLVLQVAARLPVNVRDADGDDDTDWMLVTDIEPLLACVAVVVPFTVCDVDATTVGDADVDTDTSYDTDCVKLNDAVRDSDLIAVREGLQLTLSDGLSVMFIVLSADSDEEKDVVNVSVTIVVRVNELDFVSDTEIDHEMSCVREALTD